MKKKKRYGRNVWVSHSTFERLTQICTRFEHYHFHHYSKHNLIVDLLNLRDLGVKVEEKLQSTEDPIQKEICIWFLNLYEEAMHETQEKVRLNQEKNNIKEPQKK